jgi:hypothetical protein
VIAMANVIEAPVMVILIIIFARIVTVCVNITERGLLRTALESVMINATSEKNAYRLIVCAIAVIKSVLSGRMFNIYRMG